MTLLAWIRLEPSDEKDAPITQDGCGRGPLADRHGSRRAEALRGRVEHLGGLIDSRVRVVSASDDQHISIVQQYGVVERRC